MESVHVVFDDNKISGLIDDENHDLLHFKNEICIDLNDSDDDNAIIKRNQIVVDIIPSTDNLSVDQLVSTDNVSVANPSTANQNSRSRSMDLGGVSHNISSRIQYQNQEQNHEDDISSSSRSNFPPQRKWTKSHPFELIIGNANKGVKTRNAT